MCLVVKKVVGDDRRMGVVEGWNVMVMVCKKAMLQSGQNQRAEPVGAETGPLELAQLKK